MGFAIVSIIAIVALGIVTAVASYFQGGDDAIDNSGHDCASCSSVADGSCKLGCMIEEKKRGKNNKSTQE